MAIFGAKGLKLYVGSNPIDDKNTDFILSDFDSITWVEVGNLKTIGTVGDEAGAVNVSNHSTSRSKTIKDVLSAQNLEINSDLDPDDPGQQKLNEALQSRYNYPLRIVFPDAPVSGSAPTPSERYLIGVVLSTAEILGETNTELGFTASMAVNSNVVRKERATGD